MNKVNISQIILISFSGIHREPTRNQWELTWNPPGINKDYTILSDSWWALIGSWAVPVGSDWFMGGSGRFTLYKTRAMNFNWVNCNRYFYLIIGQTWTKLSTAYSCKTHCYAAHNKNIFFSPDGQNDLIYHYDLMKSFATCHVIRLTIRLFKLWNRISCNSFFCVEHFTLIHHHYNDSHHNWCLVFSNFD